MEKQAKVQTTEADTQSAAVALDPSLAEAICAWWEDERFMDALRWWSLKNVKPEVAAMLLCCLNPDADTDPESVTTDRTTPKDYKRLLSVFRDVASINNVTLSLAQWLELARKRGLKYHPWIDEWLHARQVISAEKIRKNGTDKTDWRKEARKIAERIAMERYGRGERNISARYIARAVAEELSQRRQYWGKQGPRSESNVRNEALRGWEFNPPLTGSVD